MISFYLRFYGYLLMSGDTRYCRNCGQSLDGNAEFCSKCGTRVASVQASTFFVERKSEGLAAVLSFFIPGLGQVYNGQIGKGIIVLILFALFTASIIVLIGFILAPLFWIWNIYDAHNTAKRINQRRA